MSLLEMQAKNVDFFMVGKIYDNTSYYSPSSERHLIKGTQEMSCKLDIDSAENKTEGEIQALYGKILSASGSVKLGKISFDGFSLLTGAKLKTSGGANWMHFVRGKYLPLVFFDFQSLFDVNNGTADNRVVINKAMLSNFEFTLGQDNFAEVSFDWKSIFTVNPVVRLDPDTKQCAQIGRQTVASATLGDTIELTAAA